MGKFEVGAKVTITSDVVDMYGNVGKWGILLDKSTYMAEKWRVEVHFDGQPSDIFTLAEDEFWSFEPAAPAQQPATDAGTGFKPQSMESVEFYIELCNQLRLKQRETDEHGVLAAVAAQKAETERLRERVSELTAALAHVEVNLGAIQDYIFAPDAPNVNAELMTADERVMGIASQAMDALQVIEEARQAK